MISKTIPCTMMSTCLPSIVRFVHRTQFKISTSMKILKFFNFMKNVSMNKYVYDAQTY